MAIALATPPAGHAGSWHQPRQAHIIRAMLLAVGTLAKGAWAEAINPRAGRLGGTCMAWEGHNAGHVTAQHAARPAHNPSHASP